MSSTVVRVDPKTLLVEAARPTPAAIVAVGHDVPIEYSAPRPAPRWFVIGAGALGAGVVIELLIGVAVFL